MGSKAMFATHYHELSEMEGLIPGVKNYCIAARELGEDIVFLHRIIRGGTDKSFGIQVARLAGIPTPVIERSKVILEELRKLDVDGHILGIDRGEEPCWRKSRRTEVESWRNFSVPWRWIPSLPFRRSIRYMT